MPAAGAKLRPLDWLGGAEEKTTSADQLFELCGIWEDHKGSRYLLTAAAADSLHVHTFRPTGESRYTAHLIRLCVKRGRARVVWGAQRYALAKHEQHAITWQGRGEGDCYEWTRIN